MEGAAVTFDMRELDGVRAILQKAALSSADRDALLDSVGNIVQKQTEDRFAEQIDPEGNKWKVLAQKTHDYYIKKGWGKTRFLLIGEGNLRSQIIYEKSGWSVLVGSALEYAATHQFGRGNIPARPYLGISAENAAELAVEIQGYLASRLR
jgi:phage virion morphogenesis protein